MSRLLEVFDRIYVINLPERQDRRKEVMAQFKRAGLELEPNKVEFFPAIRPSDAGKFPNIGAHGCFMSHLNVLRRAQQEDVNRLLILEDDLDFTKYFIDNEEEVLRSLLKMTWDIAYFGHWEDLVAKKDRHDWVAVPGDLNLIMSHFMGVNRNWIDQVIPFLETMLERPPGHPDGGPMHVDGAFSVFRKQNPDIATVLSNPICGLQRSSRSDIADNKWFDRTPVIRSAASTLRYFKTRHRQIKSDQKAQY